MVPQRILVKWSCLGHKIKLLCSAACAPPLSAVSTILFACRLTVAFTHPRPAISRAAQAHVPVRAHTLVSLPLLLS
jgi:hypothetical protein